MAAASVSERLGRAAIQGLVSGLIVGALSLAGILMLPGTSEEASPAFAALEVAPAPQIDTAAR